MSNIASITCTAEESAEFDALSEKDKKILKWNLERFDVKETARPVVRECIIKGTIRDKAARAISKH